VSGVPRRVGPVFAALHRYAWLVIGVLAAAELVLGTWGFLQRPLSGDPPPTLWDALYASIQLFVLESGAISGPVGWQLNVARFLALVVAAGTALQVLAVLFYDRLQLSFLRLLGHDHVIVCGLGRKGAALVEQLRQRSEWVVVVESDPHNTGLDRCRELGAAVLLGSATNPKVLTKARVSRAKALVSVIGSDGANVETAVLARELNAGRPHGTLHCVIHVVDRGLRGMLMRTEMANREDDPFELVFFNVYEMCARVMLRNALSAVADRSPHPLVVGFGQLGETLVVQAARDWKAMQTDRKLRITVVDRHAETKPASFALRYPEVGEVCDVQFRQLDVRQPHFASGAFLADLGNQEVTAAYVCLGDDTLGMYAALALDQLLRPRGARIMVRMAERAGLAAALRAHQTARGFVDGVQAIGLLELTCTADLVPGTSEAARLRPGGDSSGVRT